jgi:hypothetical protein
MHGKSDPARRLDRVEKQAVLRRPRVEISLVDQAMRELKDRRLIYVKAGLFLLAGALASTALFAQSPTFRTAVLTAIAVWCFARFYYFAFHVMQRYVDPAYRFSGLTSLAVHFLRSRRRHRGPCK